MKQITWKNIGAESVLVPDNDHAYHVSLQSAKTVEQVCSIYGFDTDQLKQKQQQ